MRRAGESYIFRGKTENFSEREFYCNCERSCDAYNTHRGFVLRLQRARNIAGIPFLINRGCSCVAHNAAVGGKPDSTHLIEVPGDAADISTDPSRLRKYRVLATKAEIVGLIVPALLEVGFKRIGIYFADEDLFIHVDDRNWNKNQAVIIWGG